MAKDKKVRFMLVSCPSVGGEPVRIELEAGEGKEEAEVKFRRLVAGLKGPVKVVDPEEKPESPITLDTSELEKELAETMGKLDEALSDLAEARKVNEALTASLEEAQKVNAELTASLEEARSADEDMM